MTKVQNVWCIQTLNSYFFLTFVVVYNSEYTGQNTIWLLPTVCTLPQADWFIVSQSEGVQKGRHIQGAFFIFISRLNVLGNNNTLYLQ